MSSKKIPVVFTKRVEDRDASGKKVVISAGTETELTTAQFKKLEPNLLPNTALLVMD
jgi:hypothetical protein